MVPEILNPRWPCKVIAWSVVDAAEAQALPPRIAVGAWVAAVCMHRWDRHKHRLGVQLRVKMSKAKAWLQRQPTSSARATRLPSTTLLLVGKSDATAL